MKKDINHKRDYFKYVRCFYFDNVLTRYNKYPEIINEETMIYQKKIKEKNIKEWKNYYYDANGNYIYKKTRILKYILLILMILGTTALITLSSYNIIEWWWSLLFPVIIIFILILIFIWKDRNYIKFVSNPDNGLIESYFAWREYEDKMQERLIKSQVGKDKSLPDYMDLK